jgi:hypothetical protein
MENKLNEATDLQNLECEAWSILDYSSLATTILAHKTKKIHLFIYILLFSNLTLFIHSNEWKMKEANENDCSQALSWQIDF